VVPPFGVVYLITNIVNGLYYVGQTTNFRKRMVRHKRYEGGLLAVAIREFGWDRFRVEILSECPDLNSLNHLERIWIILLRSREREFGYNLMSGGFGRKMSEQAIRNMSEAQKRNPYNNYWLGKKRPDTSTRNRESRAIFFSDSANAKRKASLAIYNASDEGRANRSRSGKLGAIARWGNGS